MMQKSWVRIVLLSLPAIAVIGCILLKDFAVYIADNFIPSCDFYSSFGLYCPGCGLTRCILSIMHGKIWLAFRCNAFAFCMILGLLILYIEAVLLSFGKDVHILPRKSWFYVAFAVASAVYLILRNVVPILAPPYILN